MLGSSFSKVAYFTAELLSGDRKSNYKNQNLIL